MEGIVVLVIGILAAVPISIIVLAVRQSGFRRRITMLEATVSRLERALPSSKMEVPEPDAEPMVSELLAARVAQEPKPVEFVPHPQPALPSTIAPPPILQTTEQIVAPEPPPVVPPPIEPVAAEAPKRVVDWEKFLGVKLFAWIGGLALFLGISFFVKYSFEHNLIPPEVRVALGFLVGIGLIIGGVLMRRKEYAVTSQTLCATGVVALYGVSFAAHGIYHLIGSGAVFALMTLITAAAFTLAVRLDAKVVAVLGLAGGFLTPPLLSTGQDNPLGLFSYIALLNLGLFAISFRQRWHFLILLGAVGTAFMELGWLAKFFAVEKSYTALTVVALFNVIEVGGFFVAERLNQRNRDSAIGATIQSIVTFLFALHLISMSAMATHPGLLLTLIMIADVALLLLPLGRSDLFRTHLLAGAATLCTLGVWIQSAFREQDLYWALGATLVFALLHSIYPLILQRRRQIQVPLSWLNLFPLAGIALMLLVLLQLNAVSLMVWPIIFLLDLLVIGLAFVTASLSAALGAILMTGLFTMAWLFRLPKDIASGGVVLILGLFAVLFFAAGIWLCRKTAEAVEASSAARNPMQRYLPAISAILPFMLLALMITRLSVPNPSNVFGLGLVLAGMMLWLGKRTAADELHVAALSASLFLQYFWHQNKFLPAHSGVALTWYLVFYAMFTAYPFIFKNDLQNRVWPWVASALAGPLHFFLIYKASAALLPGFGGMGLIPGALANPAVLALATVLKRFEISEEQRMRLLALFGGSALFFITMIFPIQFSRQWLTIGWALEGAALLWLFQRVPHRGLPIVGVALLVISFARLGLNPNVFGYYPRSETRILNWYLYSYGIVTVSLLLGGKWLQPPRHLVLGRNAQPLLYSLGAVLAFILLNIEIADFFAEGNFLSFEFSGNFARDMTYSIAWALFALALLLIGIRKDLAPVRYASLGLLGVTLLKLFFHDLSQLGQLYRIGAFIGVAIILMFASWLYQRFLAGTKKES